MYHALYRKYRPNDFESVVGQNSIIKTLKNSIINNSFSHAYMFFGPRGVGKTTVSKIFARSINCLEPIDGVACGKCNNCTHSFEKECVDIIEIDAASNNGVEEIRDLRSKIALVPAELKYKVYIIDEVHMLSMGAFNALLKTLEEPPEHAVFILATTDPQKVPDTIISRCQCFSFKRISVNMIVDRLKYVCDKENILIDDAVLIEIAECSEGGMRDSLGMLDKLRAYSADKITIEDFTEMNGTLSSNDLKVFCDSLFSNNIADVLKKISKYNDDGKNLILIINQLLIYLKNLLVDYYINNTDLLYNVSSIEQFVNILNEKMNSLKASGNTLVYIEMLLLNFMNSSNNLVADKIISQEIKAEDILPNNSSIIFDKTIDSKEKITREVMKKEEEKTKDILVDSSVDNDDSLKLDNKVSEDVIKVLNIDDIINVRINNTLAKADKNILTKLTNRKIEFNDYTFDQEFGFVVCTILDGNFRAASSDNIIISYEYDSIVKQNLAILDKITDVFNKILNVKYKIAIISNKKWDVEKNNYINNIKNSVKLDIKDEPEEVFEELQNDDIISNSAVDLFGDIVEIK